MFVAEYVRPKNVEEAYQALIKDKKNLIIAGGAWMKLTKKSASKLISLEGLDLNKIVATEEMIEIGSMVTLREIETNENILNTCSGILSLACHNIMGINIRNIATIGGSVMARLAFSDIYPALLVLDASLVFYKSGEVSFADFLSHPNHDPDLLLGIRISRKAEAGYFRKVAITALDFAIVNLALSKTADSWRIAVGATPFIASLAIEAANYLDQYKELNDEIIQTAVNMALDEIKVSKNQRGSKEYRIELIKTYLKRGIRSVSEHVG
ncbi:MAG: FAD binding domain-containing protein [Bacilli bacterium]|nr:FAD binding domain-containing protein [Bacilli bacterium]MBN2877457.1 FAD binding domain-containing protein [Bacilli bacterium]